MNILKKEEYTKKEIKSWQEFEEALTVTGITINSHKGMSNLFVEFKKFKTWQEKQNL